MKIFLKIVLCFIVISFTQAKAAEGDFDVLQKFTQALYAKNYDVAKNYISAGSTALYDRYVKYDLGNMTPTNIVFLSETKSAQFRYLRVGNNTFINGKPKATKVALITENGAAKIDLPETLRQDFGPNWQSRLDLIEQSYVFAKQNLGDEKAAQMLSTMLMKK